MYGLSDGLGFHLRSNTIGKIGHNLTICNRYVPTFVFLLILILLKYILKYKTGAGFNLDCWS